VKDSAIYDLLKQNQESNEEGTEGRRTEYLIGLAKRLKLTIKTAELFKQNAGPNAVMKVTWSDASSQGVQPKLKLGAVPATQGSVRKLVKLHQSAQDNTVMAARLNNEVVRLRQWLTRQGAKLTRKGAIVWPKSARVVEYDRDLARRGLTRVRCVGKRLTMADGTPLDTSNMVTAFSGPGYAIYVMSAEGHIHVSTHSVGHRHHSSLLAGADVACAGELKVERGILRHLSNKSGHYRPDVLNLVQVLAELQEGAIPFDFSVEQLNADKTSTRHDSADAFMRANHFDNRSYAAVLYAQRAIRNTAPIEDIPEEEFFEAAYEAAADEESANPYLTVEEFTYAPAT